ncbi:aldo/keto reductase [Flavilitoribacter nigricans]|uniref:Aldo/keto reductase n=1 Tax=Flavilitoribacter nigricans (strain ATCC 23147 / DSM 23189 / NBRC 102662 / NCIMB 1420 / SS-2) TaxID=1122177 RepID=A0A2D0N9L6_FLAN2|nr:aldo/keto reductase [Flavilitoribacter nigricans]PHN05066.1 aldo/keto reductase [Flavilitoribacter nigricans DSM 23189 = NBRC 102662]
MEYKLLGRTGVKVSSLCFGTMSFGGNADAKTSADMFHRCRDAGVNFFDCADVYVQGRSEEILGKLIADCRDQVVITSKVYFSTGKGVNDGGASRYHIVRAVEASLRRLNTDYIDLYFIHHFDETTPLEETLSALNDLVRQGKILYIGASNYAAWQVAKALGISRQHAWARFECIQPMYNLVKRQAEVEILPMAISEQVGVISYSPLGGGLLTGKYGADKRPESGRLMENEMYRIRYGDQEVYRIAEDFTELSGEVGIHPVSLAIAWVNAHDGITAPIIGARNTDQLEPALAAVEVDMSPELYNRIAALSPEPPLATDRNEEATDFEANIRK